MVTDSGGGIGTGGTGDGDCTATCAYVTVIFLSARRSLEHWTGDHPTMSGTQLDPEEQIAALGSALLPHEVDWRNKQPLLAAHGYRLRPRLRPGWVPSWTTRNIQPMDAEDFWALPVGHVQYASKQTSQSLVVGSRGNG